MEEDGSISAETQSQTTSRSSDVPSCDPVEGSSVSRGSGQRRTETGEDVSPKKQQTNLTPVGNNRDSMKHHEVSKEIGEELSENNITRSNKRKLEFFSQNSTTAGEQGHSQSGLEKECPEDPPPTKKWVIGPLFQSFKSKMASFTEIVMSPVRLFKPHESMPLRAETVHHEPLSGSSSDSTSTAMEEEVNACKDEALSDGEQRNSAQKMPAVVQRLCFDSHSSNTSHSEVNTVADLLSRSETKRDCLPGQSQTTLGDDGSLGSTTTSLSSQAEAPSVFASAHQCSLEKNWVHENTDFILQKAIRSSPRKGTKPPLDSLKFQGSTEGLSPVKAAIMSNTLCEVRSLDEVTKHTEYKSNKEQALTKPEAVPSLSMKKHKRCNVASRTKTRVGLEKGASAKNVPVRLTRSKRGGKVDESQSVTLQNLAASMTSVEIGKQRKVVSTSEYLGLSDKPLSLCSSEDDGLTSGSCVATEKVEADLERPSRHRKRRDMKCGVPEGLVVLNDIGDASSSSDAIKSALMSSANTTNGSDGSLSTETPLSTGSTLPQRTLPDLVSEKQTVPQKTRERKNANRTKPCEEKPWRDMVLEHPETSRDQEASSGLASHVNNPPSVRRNTTRQAKHKFCTSLGGAQLEPAAKKLLVPSTPSLVKKAVDVFEEQRMSMSLTLHVGSKDERKGSLLVRPSEDGSTAWQNSRSVRNSGVKRRGQKEKRTEPGSVSKKISELFENRSMTTECIKSPSLFDRDCGSLEKKERLGVAKRRSDWQRRRCLTPGWRHGSPVEEEEEEEEEEDRTEVPVVPSSGSGSNRLLRSFSCPDIPSLLHGEHPPMLLPHDRTPSPTPQKYTPVPLHARPHSPSKRARRHTVCSVEIEREIAPLCLRKEVHPTGWSSLFGRHTHPPSPSASFAALASCFLSSPLAFLSKKSSRERTSVGESGNSSSGHSPPCASSCSFLTTLSPSSPKSLSAPCRTTSPAFSITVPPTPEPSVSPHCSAFEPVPGGDGAAQQEHEEDGILSHARNMSEEKALSDSEIKADSKQVERRKVSSIRIRKTLPKPQYNLTPMGLPKAVRVKKKVFSVEEIYTNKNFSKPPEGRLETIFEDALNRRDGSQSWFSQKRVKRFVEFPELGVARKPKKPLVGSLGGGGVQRKAVGNSGTGRTRRGVWASARDEVALNLQDMESLLCSKLKELDSWMALEQLVY